MPDFSRSEYASYMQLCRELRLERRLQPGDFYWEFGVVLQKDRLQVFAPVRAGRPVILPRGNETTGTVWLLALADWLEMLEAAGIGVIEIERREDRYEAIGGQRAWDCEWSCSADAATNGPTREEAVGRLWVAVKKD